MLCFLILAASEMREHELTDEVQLMCLEIITWEDVQQ